MKREARVVVLVALTACAVATRGYAQHAVSVEGPPRAKATAIVRRALAGPHDVIVTDSLRRLLLPRGSDLPRSVIVLGGDASVGATVRGDVLVVGGDLFLHPGALIEGSAIAIGGAVYGSTLAAVQGGTESVRDHTFDVTQTPTGIRLLYRHIGGREPRLEFPLAEGLRIPAYDRVDGVSVPWGPVLRPTVRLEIDPTVTYRSHLGAWDPGATALLGSGEPWSLTLDARRGTFTNDAWIRSDILNSLTSLVSGSDTRNYYRADRAELAVRRFDQSPDGRLELERFAGVLTERAWSVGSVDTLGSRPWSLTGESDIDKVRRANPPIDRGRISSGFLGAVVHYQLGDIRMSGSGRLEAPWQSPGDERFAQITFDGTVRFPTFGAHRFRTDLHVVATVGDTTPAQRYAYLGGSGTLPVIDDLSMGGDQLLHLDSRYEIPIQRVRIPFAGSPTLGFRHRIGSAGEQRLPRLVQNVSALVSLSFLRVEFAIDPASGERRFKAGLSFAR